MMQTMNSLAQLTIDAHGGTERWRRFALVSAHLCNDGVLWTLKHQHGVLDDINVRVALGQEEHAHGPNEAGRREACAHGPDRD